MPRDIVSVGVDLGGTWVRLSAANAQGHILRHDQADAPTLTHLPKFLKQKLHAWKIHPQHLIVASRGIWTPLERRLLKHSLKALARRVTVMSDVEAAWHAAFDRFGGTGIVVIAGTGSIAWGRDRHGCAQRAGGLGPLLGDEGSAFWIGKTWLKGTHGHNAAAHVLKLVRSPDYAVRRIAALVPRILKRANHGDKLASRVVQDAQMHLAHLVLETTRQLHFQHTVPVSWGGSVLNNSRFRLGFTKTLQRLGKNQGWTFRMTTPGHSPSTAIAKLF